MSNLKELTAYIDRHWTPPNRTRNVPVNYNDLNTNFDSYKNIIGSQPMPWAIKTKFMTNLFSTEKNKAKLSSNSTRSKCKVCDYECDSLDYGMEKFVWPYIFKHYVINHNTYPSKEFLDYILGY